MVNLDVAELRPKINVTELYVDFGILRTALSVNRVAKDSGVRLSEPSYEGGCRAKCPKCGKEKSLTLNISTNRFNCFAKKCAFKGGGAIDFFSRLNEVSAKDASHLLACAYGITPYGFDAVMPESKNPSPSVNGKAEETGEEGIKHKNSNGYVPRKDFEDLKSRFERLSNIVWTFMLENDRPGGIADEYDPALTKNHLTG